MIQNKLLDILYESKKVTGYKKIISIFKLYKLMYTLKRTRPTFEDLLAISNFVNIIEQIFLHEQNSILNSLQSSNKLETYGFIIRFNTDQFVIVKLFPDDKIIDIEIRTSKNKHSSIRFEDGDNSIIETEYDEVLFINIIDWIMDAVVVTLKKVYFSNKIYSINK